MNTENFWGAVEYGYALVDNAGFDIMRHRRQMQEAEAEKRAKRWIGLGLILATLAGSFAYIVTIF